LATIWKEKKPLKTNNYRLLVIDIDGTLISKDAIVSQENKEALELARERGIAIALSTGRTVTSCQRIIEQLTLDGYHIFFDGALVCDCVNREHVYIRPVEKTLVKEMVEFANANNIDLELASAKKYFADHETWSTEVKRNFFDIETIIGDLSVPCETEEIIRLDIVVSNLQEQAGAELFMKQFAGRSRFSQAHSPQFPNVTFINIISPGTSKGEALRALSLHLDVKLDEVVAVGDWTNDIPLLMTAGLKIAMGNAHNDLKAIADYVTLKAEEHGLATAVHKFLL
jgi:Cof subfamily protein (haloacid dehalogenase superfamily)